MKILNFSPLYIAACHTSMYVFVTTSNLCKLRHPLKTKTFLEGTQSENKCALLYDMLQYIVLIRLLSSIYSGARAKVVISASGSRVYFLLRRNFPPIILNSSSTSSSILA